MRKNLANHIPDRLKKMRLRLNWTHLRPVVDTARLRPQFLDFH
jgi:hypothetical protein